MNGLCGIVSRVDTSNGYSIEYSDFGSFGLAPSSKSEGKEGLYG